MQIIGFVLFLIIYKMYKSGCFKGYRGIRDWEKWNHYKYHVGLPDSEMKKLLDAGFFDDPKATAEFERKNPDWPYKRQLSENLSGRQNICMV